MKEKKRDFKKQRPHTPKTGRDHHEDMVANVRSWVRRERELLAYDLEQQGNTDAALAVLDTAAAFDSAFDKLVSLVGCLVDKPKATVEPPPAA